jgi:hypothetical protein
MVDRTSAGWHRSVASHHDLVRVHILHGIDTAAKLRSFAAERTEIPTDAALWIGNAQRNVMKTGTLAALDEFDVRAPRVGDDGTLP